MTGYQFSLHAFRRMEERAITPDDLAGAFAGECAHFGDGVVHYYDRRSRVRVVANPVRQTIVTVVRHTPREGRQLLIAMRQMGQPI
jgi:hypothetical protein